MDKITKAKYKRNRDKGIMACPYCENESLKVHDLTMASDESYATRYILCNPESGCGKGWTEYWHMTDVEAD
jgi:transcriptional regulator NrdR family protein